jgi:hypothetical protein
MRLYRPQRSSGTRGCFREWSIRRCRRRSTRPSPDQTRRQAGRSCPGKNTVVSLFKGGYTMIAASTELTLLRGGARAEVDAVRKQFP